MAANDAGPKFRFMSEVELRQWVEANPGRVNHWDSDRWTPLLAAINVLDSVPLVLWLVLWLVREKRADLNAADSHGNPPLKYRSQ
jgi:hypothetical protein